MMFSLSQGFTVMSDLVESLWCEQRLQRASVDGTTITMCRWSPAQGPVGGGHALISTVPSCSADLHTSGDPSRAFPPRAAGAESRRPASQNKWTKTWRTEGWSYLQLVTARSKNIHPTTHMHNVNFCVVQWVIFVTGPRGWCKIYIFTPVTSIFSTALWWYSHTRCISSQMIHDWKCFKNGDGAVQLLV